MTYEELYRNCDCEEELNHKVKSDINIVSDLPLEEKSKKLREIMDASKKIADERNWFLDPITIATQTSKATKIINKLKQKLIKDFQEEHNKRTDIEKFIIHGRKSKESYWIGEWNKHNERMIYIQNLINYIENNEHI